MKQFFAVLLLLFAADVGFNIYQWQKTNEIEKLFSGACDGTDSAGELLECMEIQYDSARDDIKTAKNELSNLQKVTVVKYITLTVLVSILIFLTFFNGFFQNGLKGKYKFMVIVSHLFFLFFFFHSVYEWVHYSKWDEIYNSKNEGLEDLSGLFEYGKLLFAPDQIKLVIKNSIIVQIGVLLYFRLYFKIRKIGKETSFEEGNYQEIES